MKIEKHKGLIIFSFLLPGLLLYVGLMLVPSFEAFVLSLFKWNSFRTRLFVGLANYQWLFQDRIFRRSLFDTVEYMVVNVPLQVVTAYILAYLLYLRLTGYRVFRFVFFVPVVLLTVGVGIFADTVFSPWFGPFGKLFHFLGLTYNDPLANSKTAIFFVILVDWWKWLGTKIMLFYAGFQNISEEVIEAAKLDGASGARLLFNIIVPLSWEILTMVIVLMIIGSLKVFDMLFVMTQGGPNHSTEVLTIYLYNTAFSQQNFGGASSVAVVLFVVIIFITMLMRRLFQRDLT